MIEARITCTCTQISLPDIELDLLHGQVVFLPEAQAKKSQDLSRASKAKAVEVVYVQRYQKQRTHESAPPPARRPTVATPHPPPVPTGTVAPIVVQPTVVLDPDELATKVVQRLALPKTDAVQAEVRQQLDAMRATLRAELRADMVDVLRAAGADIPAPGSVRTGTVQDDEPVFIPSKIGEDLKADIGVAETTSTAGVADAAAALRAARASKKERKS